MQFKPAHETLLFTATLSASDISHHPVTINMKLQNLLIKQKSLKFTDWLEGRASLKNI